MVEALLGGDLGDVNETFDAFRDGDEGTELGDLRDGAFDDGAGVDGFDELCEGVAEGLLEAEAHALGFGVDGEDDWTSTGVAYLDDVRGLADFFAPGHFGLMWMRPSMPGAISTKAPKSASRGYGARGPFRRS